MKPNFDEAKADRRAKNVVNAREILAEHHIQYRESRASQGKGLIMFIIETAQGRVNYFPETGSWWNHDKEQRFGCKNLVKYINGDAI